MNFLASFLLALMLTDQTPKAPQPQAPAKPDEQRGVAPERYVIGPQDQLSITVYDEPDLTNKYRVDDAGMVAFPLISRIPASGLTISEFQERLRAMLANGYIRNPQVRVDIDQYKSQSVFVVGEVRAPGKVPMTGITMTLLEALALAGSPTANASNEVLVIHPKKPNSAGSVPSPDADQDAEQIRINLKDLQVGRAGQDVVLRDGDIINVPKAQTFYITGQVRNPGSYVLDPGMTVLQAISLAGGLSDRGSDRGINIRRIVNSKLLDVGVKPEDKVQPNDTIIVRQRFF